MVTFMRCKSLGNARNKNIENYYDNKSKNPCTIVRVSREESKVLEVTNEIHLGYFSDLELKYFETRLLLFVLCAFDLSNYVPELRLITFFSTFVVDKVK